MKPARRTSPLHAPPALALERLLWDLGRARVAGVDEVGLGPLAGPVMAAAVVFSSAHDPIPGVADSKQVSALRREPLAAAIRERAIAVSVGRVEVTELDQSGVHAAGLEAMRRAVVGLAEQGCDADYALVDARTVPGLSIGQTAYTKGDSFIYSVAAASIVAKVERDAIMRELDAHYPDYGFARHMGYGTAAHLEALDRLGPCEIHRRSFEPVRRRLLADGAEATGS